VDDIGPGGYTSGGNGQETNRVDSGFGTEANDTDVEEPNDGNLEVGDVTGRARTAADKMSAAVEEKSSSDSDRVDSPEREMLHIHTKATGSEDKPASSEVTIVRKRGSVVVSSSGGASSEVVVSRKSRKSGDTAPLGNKPPTGMAQQLRQLTDGIKSRRQASSQVAAALNTNEVPANSKRGGLMAQLNQQMKARGRGPLRMVSNNVTPRRSHPAAPTISPASLPTALVKLDYIAVYKAVDLMKLRSSYANPETKPDCLDSEMSKWWDRRHKRFVVFCPKVECPFPYERPRTSTHTLT